MMDTNFNIRLATKKDLDFLVYLHYESFKTEEHIPMLLGKKYVRATYSWHINCINADIMIAESQGKVMGYMGFCDGSYTFPMFVACLPEFVISLLSKPCLFFNKRLWQRYLRRSYNNGNVYDGPGFAQLTIGAVDADYRGRGVYPALVEASKEYCRARGSG